MLIVDLTDLTGQTYTYYTTNFDAAHNIYIDENGVAYIFGADVGNGGAIFLDVNANPTNPIYLGEWDDEYIHDGMARGDTMYAGCINTGDLYIVDVSNKTNPVVLGTHQTPNAFSHNAWVSDDGDYVFTTDEKPGAYLAATRKGSTPKKSTTPEPSLATAPATPNKSYNLRENSLKDFMNDKTPEKIEFSDVCNAVNYCYNEPEEEIKKKIEDSGSEITLATVLVGDDKPSQLYVNNKHKAGCKKLIQKHGLKVPKVGLFDEPKVKTNEWFWLECHKPQTTNNLKIKFLSKRKATYVISAILILISISSLVVQGLNQGVDFLGGRSYIVRFDKEVKSSDIESTLNNAFGSAEVKTFGASNQLKITTKYKVHEEGLEVDNEIKNILFENLNSQYITPLTLQQFSIGEDVGIMSSIKVGPTIADDIKQNSVWAIFGSLIIVFLYKLLRFQKWQYSIGAVSAVFHDVLIVLGIFSLTYKIMPFNMEINQAFIAALLTVIGYSLNDTVVVFDRIREFFRIHKSWDNDEIVNTALNSTLSRTLNTSLTTLIVLIAIFIFGGESIRGFMFALIIGVLVGTYSSVFIATPIMFDSYKKGD